MPRMPKSSIASMVTYMDSIRFDDPNEKAVFMRIATLIDAVIENERGHTNAGAIQVRNTRITLKTPQKVAGTVENIFNGLYISLEPLKGVKALSQYEVEIDTQPNFSSPTKKDTFNLSVTFKGLLADTLYYVRARAITKQGDVGDWIDLGTGVTAGSQIIEAEGTVQGDNAESGTFTFNTATEDILVASNFGDVELENNPVEALASDNIAPTTVSLRVRRSTVVQETIELAGSVKTIGSGDTQQPFTLHRFPVIAFFDLIAPSGTPPVNYSFDVQRSEAGATFTVNTEPTVFVKF